MSLPRQPEPVKVTFEGHPEDRKYIEQWMLRLRNYIEDRSYDNATVNRETLVLTIYPRAVND